MFVPFASHAVVDIRKLTDYCLSPRHEQGKHKARLFAVVLGITEEDAAQLRVALLTAVRSEQADIGRRDVYGQRYLVDFQLEWRGAKARIRSCWMIEHGSSVPRLTPCYVL